VESRGLRIEKALNLTQEFETDKGTVYLHSMPISKEMWRRYFLILSKTYSQLFAPDLLNAYSLGPPPARLMLQHVATLNRVWEGEDGVEQVLLAEIRRLSNVVMQSEGRWQTVPYDQVLRQKLIDEDDLEDMENCLIFFICVSAYLRGRRNKEKLDSVLTMMKSQWNAPTTSLACMEFAASLPTSTPTVNIGAMAVASSVPH
jgi:hypothetical protein